MAALTFLYDHSRDPMNPDQLGNQIGVALGLNVDPVVDIDPTRVFVTHPAVTEQNRAVIQALIDAYVYDPVWAGGIRGVIAQKAASALTANATFQAFSAPTNAQTLAQVQLLTRECNALIRLALDLFDTTKGT